MKYWYEVKRCVKGESDVITSIHPTEQAAKKAEQEAIASGKYEVVYYKRYDKDGVLD